MTSHAAIRVGPVRMTWLRLRAAVNARIIPWQIRREARRQADGAPFWGDTGTIGDLSYDDSDICPAGWHAAGSAPQFCDSCRDHLPPIPDDGWRPTSGHALHELSTWQPDSWTQDLPGPAQDDWRAQPSHQGNRAQTRAGESSVAVPVSRERVLTATVRATPRPARTWPEAATPTPPPPATRYAPTADEIRATLHARVIKALGGVDANGWDTVVTRIYEAAAAKVYTGERM